MAATNLIAGKAIAADGWQVPPEEAPHSATLMMWPNSRRVYPDRIFLRMAQRAIVDVANAIAAFEPVFMLADAGDHPEMRRQLRDDITLWDIATEDLWCRDAGPLFARHPNQGLAVQHIRFNGWGAKQRHTRDGQVAERVAERLGLALRPTGLVGEPGGVEQDGHGLLMAHESSWHIDNRNPGLSRDEIEARLLAAYGAQRMVWSPGLKNHDITDYHIDSLARFTGPAKVLMNLPQQPDSRDPFHKAALQTHAAFQAAGLEIEVIPEPLNPRVKSLDFVASYANYYVCNGAVIAAQFGDDDSDQQAAQALARHYPGREVLTLDVDPLGELGGGIHCATQQIPLV